MSESPHSGLQSQSVQGTNTQYVHISTRDVKKQAQVKTFFFSVTPYGWKWDVNSMFKKEDRRPCSRSLQQSWCFFQDYRSYEWFHLRLYTLVQYAPLYSCELCLQYFLLAEATQVSLQVSFPIAQSTLQWGCHACSQHLWLQFWWATGRKVPLSISFTVTILIFFLAKSFYKLHASSTKYQLKV